MRTKVTLVLLFLNVALFFFIFYMRPRWEIDPTRITNRVLAGSETANIQVLEIAEKNEPPIRLQRAGELWELTAPYAWPANPHAVARIVNELQLLEHETSFAVADLATNGQSLSDYGLADDQVSLTVGYSSQRPEPGAAPALTTLRIGDETKVGNRLYVLSPDGTRIHVVGRSLAESLRHRVDELRADTFFTIPVFEVRSLNLQTAAPANLRVRLRRDGGRWTFENPINARADKTATEIALSSLNALHTGQFVGTTVSEQSGLRNPRLRITLEGNNRRETLLIGAEAPAGAPAADARPAQDSAPAAATDPVFYAKMEDKTAIFTVALPADLKSTLDDVQEKLRERRILDLEGRIVTAITLAAPTSGLPELTLQRLDGGAGTSAPWQLVRRLDGQSPQTLPADRKIVENLLQRLAFLSAQTPTASAPSGFLSDAPTAAELENWGLTRPEREITLTLQPLPGASGPAAAPTTVKLLLGVASERDGRVYAKLAQQSFVYLVSPEILQATPVVPRIYRERIVRELEPGTRITGIKLTDTPSSAVLYAHDLAEGATWENDLASEPADRRAALEALLTQLRNLRAKNYVRDDFPPTISIGGEDRAWQYRLDVTLALVSGEGARNETLTLFFTERLGGTTQLVGYAGDAAGSGVVFEAEQPLLDALWSLTYGPRDPGP
ncbi:MAG TPA: DUF4340 domain-containing protein, partial [Opitutaceae bacterium]